MSRSPSANARPSNVAGGKHAQSLSNANRSGNFSALDCSGATRLGALFLPCLRALEVLIQVAALGRF